MNDDNDSDNEFLFKCKINIIRKKIDIHNISISNIIY